MTKQFRVYDNYDYDMELLGMGDIDRCRYLAYGRILDTDDECCILIETPNREIKDFYEWEEELEMEGLI